MRNLLTKPCAIALAVASGFSQHALANEADIAAQLIPPQQRTNEDPKKLSLRAHD